MKGRTRKYFSKQPDTDGMVDPKQISGTDIYVEMHASFDNKLRYAQRVLSLFGGNGYPMRLNWGCVGSEQKCHMD